MEETVHDNFFKNFTVVTATISAADYLPENSGIYAFYHAFDFLENNLSEHIDTRIKNTVFKTKFSEKDNRSKFIVDTCGESVGLSQKMDQFIKAVSQPKERRILKNLLISCSILQRPDYIKWSSKSRNLTQLDPYLTTLDLVSQCTIELLKDYQKQALKKSFNSPSERNKALDDYYESHPKLPQIGTKALLKWFFTELQPFKDWVSQINYVGINIPIQPEQSRLNASQKASIKELRESSILYTILGQKILFSAVSRFLLKIRVEYRIPTILDAISLSITKMHEDGFLDRNKDHWSNVLVQPNEKLTMITKGSGPEKCIELVKMILLDSPDGVRELIKRTRDEVSNEVNWNEALISNWRREFHVILPEVDFIDEQIKESSESEDSFAEVRDLLDSSEEEEEESDEIEDDEDIFKEAEEVKD